MLLSVQFHIARNPVVCFNCRDAYMYGNPGRTRRDVPNAEYLFNDWNPTIFGGNDPTALGAAAAAEAAQSSALIYGVDGSPDIKALIAEGKVTGSGAQSPMTIGKTIAELYYKWAAGEEVESRYPIETFMINADNVAEFGTEGWQ